MLRTIVPALLLALPLVASAHPVPADPHQGCLVVGFNGVPTPPPATLVTGLLSYTDPKAPAASTIACQSSPNPIPPGGWTYTGSEWASHAAPCPPLTLTPTSVPGVYCGGLTAGTFTCRWQQVGGAPAGAMLVVAVDVDLDGRITIVDKIGTLASPTQLAPWVGEPLGPWSAAFPSGGTFGVVNVRFPPGRIMAFPTTYPATALDPTAVFSVDCA